MANVVKAVADPFDVSLGARRCWRSMAGGWDSRRKRPTSRHRSTAVRIQGSGKVYTYKLFLEAAHHLLRDGGRFGMLVPSGIYTDKARPSSARRSLSAAPGSGATASRIGLVSSRSTPVQVRPDHRRARR